MSKEIKEAKDERTFTRKQVFVSLLPWAIILIAIVAIVSVITGWTLRSADQCRIEAAASALVKSLK